MAAASCSVIVLAACANMGAPPEEQVRQRASERWEALVAGDFNRAYEFSTAGFKAVVSPDGFRRRAGSSVTWVGTEVVNVKCDEPAKCIATVRIDFKALLGGQSTDPFNTHVTETWLLESGKWWIFPNV